MKNMEENQHKFKFKSTSCSQCGQEFGPGDSGFSHCEDHYKATSVTVPDIAASCSVANDSIVIGSVFSIGKGKNAAKAKIVDIYNAKNSSRHNLVVVKIMPAADETYFFAMDAKKLNDVLVASPLGRKIARIDYDNYPIPDDCPLKTPAEKATNFILDT